MHKNLTRFELIEKSFSAANYLNQIKGVLGSMLDLENTDSGASWRYSALLTLVCAASNELEPVVNSKISEPEGSA